MDGVEYIDEDSILKTFPGVVNSQKSFPELYLNKEEVLPGNMTFCKKTAADILEAGNNRIIFFDVSGEDSFEKIHFMYLDESMEDEIGSIHGISYFGPAQTTEEAQQVAAYFGRNIN